MDDLFLRNDLLKQMVEGKFLKGLFLFKERMLYSNTFNDNRVVYQSSAIWTFHIDHPIEFESSYEHIAKAQHMCYYTIK